MIDPRHHPRVPVPVLGIAAVAGRRSEALRRDPLTIQLARGHWARFPLGTVLPDPPLNDAERAALLQLSLGSRAVVTHESAAALWGLPVPAGMSWSHRLVGDDSAPRPRHRPGVHLALQNTQPHWGNRTIHGHRPVALPPVAGPWGAQLVHPVELLVQLYDRLPGWTAIAAAEHVLRWGCSWMDPGPVTGEQLLADLRGLPRRRGCARIRSALQEAVPGSRSPMETLLRLIVERAGIPRPEMSRRVVLGKRGESAELDLSWPERRTGLEYNGVVHYRDWEHYRFERIRFNRLVDERWQIREVVVDDLKHPQRLSALIAWLRKALGLA